MPLSQMFNKCSPVLNVVLIYFEFKKSKNPEVYLEVIYSPGHTTDSVIYYSAKDAVAFVGDTMFKGSIGNDQYPGGNGTELRRSIIEKIFLCRTIPFFAPAIRNRQRSELKNADIGFHRIIEVNHDAK